DVRQSVADSYAPVERLLVDSTNRLRAGHLIAEKPGDLWTHQAAAEARIWHRPLCGRRYSAAVEAGDSACPVHRPAKSTGHRFDKHEAFHSVDGGRPTHVLAPEDGSRRDCEPCSLASGLFRAA